MTSAAFDWSALGTWAAVVVAISIALKDTVTRQRDNGARHVLVAATIFPDVIRLHDGLGEVLEMAAEADRSGDNQRIAKAAESIETILRELSLEHIREHAYQPNALPERALLPLAKAINLIRMLNENATIARMELARSRGSEEEMLVAAFQEWQQQGASVRNSLGHVARECEALLRSCRY